MQDCLTDQSLAHHALALIEVQCTRVVILAVEPRTVCTPVLERPRLEELHRLVSIAAPLLADDDVRPLLFLRRKQQSRDVEVADAFPARTFLDNDIHGCLCLCDDRLVICA